MSSGEHCAHCHAQGEAYLFLRYRGHTEPCAVGMVWHHRQCDCGLVRANEADDATVPGR